MISVQLYTNYILRISLELYTNYIPIIYSGIIYQLYTKGMVSFSLEILLICFFKYFSL